jgi:hypothetical protein
MGHRSDHLMVCCQDTSLLGRGGLRSWSGAGVHAGAFFCAV